MAKGVTTTEKKVKASQEELHQKLQEKYMEYQMIEEQTKKMQEQLETFDKQVADLEGIKDALNCLKEIKQGTEIFVPISSGIFVKAEIKETKELLVNVGDNVVVQKDMEDAVKLIIKQQEEIGLFREKVQSNAMILAEHSKKIENDVLKFSQSVE